MPPIGLLRMYCTNDDCPELAIDCPGHDENNLGIIASTLSAASLAHSSSSPSPDLVVASSLHPLSLLPSSPLSNLTAVVLLPPRDLWEPIQSIRRLLDKKHVDRWPPHVTLFYPFYPPGLLEQATELLRQEAGSIDAFSVNLSSFGNFSQSKGKRFVTWLSPEPNDRVTGLRNQLHARVPACSPRFEQPHMTVARGQTSLQDKELQRSWAPLQFYCASIAVLQRPDTQSPMRVVATLVLRNSRRLVP